MWKEWLRKNRLKLKELKNMYVDPFALGVIVGAFSMLVSIVMLALIIIGKIEK